MFPIRRVRTVVTPGRHEDYAHAEVNFEYVPQVRVDTPEVYPTPEKKKTRDTDKWLRNLHPCNITCVTCGDNAVVRKSDIKLQDVGTVCARSCKLKCSTIFPLESRVKIRKLRHDAYSRGTMQPFILCAQLTPFFVMCWFSSVVLNDRW